MSSSARNSRNRQRRRQSGDLAGVPSSPRRRGAGRGGKGGLSIHMEIQLPMLLGGAVHPLIVHKNLSVDKVMQEIWEKFPELWDLKAEEYFLFNPRTLENLDVLFRTLMSYPAIEETVTMRKKVRLKLLPKYSDVERARAGEAERAAREVTETLKARTPGSSSNLDRTALEGDEGWKQRAQGFADDLNKQQQYVMWMQQKLEAIKSKIAEGETGDLTAILTDLDKVISKKSIEEISSSDEEEESDESDMAVSEENDEPAHTPEPPVEPKPAAEEPTTPPELPAEPSKPEAESTESSEEPTRPDDSVEPTRPADSVEPARPDEPTRPDERPEESVEPSIPKEEPGMTDKLPAAEPFEAESSKPDQLPVEPSEEPTVPDGEKADVGEAVALKRVTDSIPITDSASSISSGKKSKKRGKKDKRSHKKSRSIQRSGSDGADVVVERATSPTPDRDSDKDDEEAKTAEAAEPALEEKKAEESPALEEKKTEEAVEEKAEESPALEEKKAESPAVEEKKKESREERLRAEFLSTEEAYVRGLEVLTQLYMQPIRSGKLMGNDDLAVVFGNVETIYQIHSKLLIDLKSKELTQALEQFVPFLKMYTVYINHYEDGLARLNKLTAKSKTLAEMLQRQKDLPQSNRLPLDAYLITPVQRLPRYELLLRDLHRAMPEEELERREVVHKLLQKVVEMNRYVNEAKRGQQRRERLYKLKDACRPKGLDIFDRPDRQLLLDGKLGVKETTVGEETDVGNSKFPARYFFVFDDMIVQVQALKGGNYKFTRAYDPLRCTLKASLHDTVPIAQPPRNTDKSAGLKIVHVRVKDNSAAMKIKLTATITPADVIKMVGRRLPELNFGDYVVRHEESGAILDSHHTLVHSLVAVRDTILLLPRPDPIGTVTVSYDGEFTDIEKVDFHEGTLVTGLMTGCSRFGFDTRTDHIDRWGLFNVATDKWLPKKSLVSDLGLPKDAELVFRKGYDPTGTGTDSTPNYFALEIGKRRFILMVAKASEKGQWVRAFSDAIVLAPQVKRAGEEPEAAAAAASDAAPSKAKGRSSAKLDDGEEVESSAASLLSSLSGRKNAKGGSRGRSRASTTSTMRRRVKRDDDDDDCKSPGRAEPAAADAEDSSKKKKPKARPASMRGKKGALDPRSAKASDLPTTFKPQSSKDDLSLVFRSKE